MSITFNLDDCIKYDIIKQNLYGFDNNIKKITHKFTAIKYKNLSFIITSLNGLDGIFFEQNLDKIDIELNYNNKNIKVKLKKLVGFYDEEYDFNIKYDCYYDVYLNLLFIRSDSIDEDIKYYNLDNYDYLNYYLLDYHKMNCKINSSDLNNLSNSDYKQIIVKDSYYWEKKFLIFPEVPFLVSIFNQSSNICGADVIIDNNLVGILSQIEINTELNLLATSIYDYYITPIFAILYHLDIILGRKYLLFNLDFNIEKMINPLTGTLDNFIKINETYYNKYVTKDFVGNLIKVNDKIFDKNTLIYTIDDNKIDDDCNIIYYKKIPLKSYIWFFKKLDEDNYFSIKCETVKIINKNISLYKKVNKIYNNIKNISINLSDFKYIYYKNKYIFELNESLLFVLKKYLILEKTYHNLLSYIIQNKLKERKIIIGIEIYDINYVSDNNISNIQIKINNNLIHIKPKIFLIKKYKDIEDIYDNYSNAKNLINFINTIFIKNQ